MWFRWSFLIVLNIGTILAFENEAFKIDLLNVNQPLSENGENEVNLVKCPTNIDCVPQIQCPVHVKLTENEKTQYCTLESGSKNGFCCLNGKQQKGK